MFHRKKVFTNKEKLVFKISYFNLKVSRSLGTFVSILVILKSEEARSRDFETSP